MKPKNQINLLHTNPISMKRSILLLVAMLIAMAGIAQQLSFRMTNARIIRISNFDHLQFDVEIKASQPGTYLWASQVILHFNNNAFSNTATEWQVTRLGSFVGINSLEESKYSLTRTVTGTAPNRVYNIAYTGHVEAQYNGGNSDDFALIPTNWSPMMRVSTRLLNPVSGDPMAGIGFRVSSMNGFQQHITDPGVFVLYQNPNVYEGQDLISAYTGRMYSNTHGWTQIGGTTNGQQFLDWSANVSTTIWDGNASITHTNQTAAMANNLNILPDATLTIGANKWLTVNGQLSSPGNSALQIASTGSLLHQTPSTAATLHRSISGGSINASTHRYHLISVPMSTATPFTAGDLFIGLHLWELNAITQNWQKITASSHAINNQEGYLLWHADPTHQLSAAGLLNAGEIQLPAKELGINGFNQSYRLVVNPYPSALNWQSPSGYDAAVYFFNAETGNYVSSVDGIPHPSIVPAWQSFFIRKTNPGGTAPAITLQNNQREHHNQSFYKQLKTVPSLLSVKATTDISEDATYVRFQPQTSYGFDSQYDAVKLFGFGDAPQLYTVLEGNSFSINSLFPQSNSLTIPMHFQMNTAGNVQLTAQGMHSFSAGTTIYLEDTQLNTMVDLMASPVYSFHHQPAATTDRFRLHFNGLVNLSETEDETYRLWAYDSKVYISMPLEISQTVEIEMTDLQGRQVYRNRHKVDDPIVIHAGRVTRVLLVRVWTSSKVYFGKVLIP